MRPAVPTRRPSRPRWGVRDATRPHGRWAPALLIAGAVVLGGCGSDDEPQDFAGQATGPQPLTQTRAPTTATGTAPETATGTAPDESKMDVGDALGQMVVARFAGTEPSATLRARIRRGEVGGIILFKDNVTGGVAPTRRMVASLQREARRGDRPPLLVAIDQEGGEIRRLPGPPEPDAAAMRSADAARTEGRRTARLLRSVGVDVNLAPVADVSSGSSSFLGARAFGTEPATVAERACGFVAGLQDGHVAATLKHFPGLGTATTNTDFDRTSIPIDLERLRRDYAAYERCGDGPTTLVMLSSAIYPDALGPDPALLTRATYERELRMATGSDPLTISDDLETPSVTAHGTPSRRAINAGLDLLLYARTEQASADAYPKLLADVRAGRIRAGRVQASAARIVELKERLAQR
ncbi:MAG: glycoside hydrolase family 3 N-terminal domain-containing protein [Solirubrobacteraceae bacterium]